jgi:hypothetical protein
MVSQIIGVILITALIACMLGLCFCFFMLYRNNWVYKQRMLLIDTKWETYHNYWDYQKMMKYWWIWNVEKMKNE